MSAIVTYQGGGTWECASGGAEHRSGDARGIVAPDLGLHRAPSNGSADCPAVFRTGPQDLDKLIMLD